MADQAKIGTHWQRDELDLIVADYFAMLAAEMAGKSYVKSKHCAALMAKIGRTHRSVEFKHQNISAVLDELGMPWIPGYKPKRHYQDAIIDAIDRYLTVHPGELELSPRALSVVPPPAEVFVSPPTFSAQSEPTSERLCRLVHKFDPVERDHRNHVLGRAGEAFVVDIERRKLIDAGCRELARRVRWVAAEDGDGAGYDVLSFEPAGQERFIEVKTTNGSARTPFFLTRNECSLATECPDQWRIYRVHLFAKTPRVFSLSPPLERVLNLSPESWRAFF